MLKILMNTESRHLSNFPSINKLFKDSWATFIQSVLSLFLINIFGIVIYLVLAAFVVIVFIISGVGSTLVQNGFSNIAATLTSPGFLATATILGIISIIVFAIVSSALQIATILIVDAKGKTSVIDAFKKSLGLVIPLFLVSILTNFLTFGALFVFIFPAILVMFLLGFTQFEVILNNKRWTEAVKRSVLLISSNFWAILIRSAVLWLVFFIVFLFISLLENIFPENSQWLISILSFLVNLFLGFFALSYQIILYRHAQVGAETQKGKSITWIYILALIGWIIAIFVGFGSYKLLSSQFFKDTVGTALSENQDKKTMSAEAKIHFDKSQTLFDQIVQNQNDPKKVTQLNDENIAELKKASELEPENGQIWYELGNAYTWINTGGTLEDSLNAYKKAEKLDPKNALYVDSVAEILIRMQKYDEAVLKLQQSLRIGEEKNDESGLTHYRLGLAYAGLKIYDSAKVHLQKAIDVLSAKNNDGRFDEEILRAQKDLSNLPK